MKDHTVLNICKNLDCFYEFHTSMTNNVSEELGRIEGTVDIEFVEVRMFINTTLYETHIDWTE
jgi:hypothetical protein